MLFYFNSLLVTFVHYFFFFHFPLYSQLFAPTGLPPLDQAAPPTFPATTTSFFVAKENNVRPSPTSTAKINHPRSLHLCTFSVLFLDSAAVRSPCASSVCLTLSACLRHSIALRIHNPHSPPSPSPISLQSFAFLRSMPQGHSGHCNSASVRRVFARPVHHGQR